MIADAITRREWAKFMQKLNSLVMIFLLIGCSSLRIEADAAEMKVDNLVKTFEVESSDCIKGYSQSTDENGKPTIDRLVTVNAVKQLNMDGQFTSVFNRTTDRVNIPDGDKCPDLHSFFSPDGKYFLEQITCGPECAQTRVVNMETMKSIIPKESSYPVAATSDSFVTLNTFTRATRFFNYAGEILSDSPSMFRVLPHSNGYIGYGNGSNLYFMDSFGKVLSSVNHHSRGVVLGVDKQTGVTAIVEPKPLEFGSSSKRSRVSVYDKKGLLLQQYVLSFIGYNCGVGVAPGGEYIAVTSSKGWLRLFDVKKSKELWSRDYEYCGHFTDTTVPIPISVDGKYTIVYGLRKGVTQNTALLLIFDRNGEICGTLEPPVSQSVIYSYHVEFLGKSLALVTFSDVELCTYQINESSE